MRKLMQFENPESTIDGLFILNTADLTPLLLKT
jgi:hypothetical protein